MPRAKWGAGHFYERSKGYELVLFSDTNEGKYIDQANLYSASQIKRET